VPILVQWCSGVNPVLSAISLADAWAAALAKTDLARIVTGDPEFKPLEENHIVEILWLPMKAVRPS